MGTPPTKVSAQMLAAIAADTFNSFLEDTCVLVTIGFLSVRGRLFELLFLPNASPILGALLFGVAGASEFLIPGGRDPYAMDTLAVVVAMIALGPRASAGAALLCGLASLLQPVNHNGAAIVGLAAAFLIARLGRRWLKGPIPYFAMGFVAQAGSIAAIEVVRLAPDVPAVFVSSLANGFGAWLLGMVVRDAQTRHLSAELAAESERARELARGAQISALRARLRPHFLFNALNSIVSLSDIDPVRARKATINLSQLMRAALATDPSAKVSLQAELDAVRAYTEIEAERFGDRLKVIYDLEPGLDFRLPAFGIQLLVENAVVHGMGRLRRKVEVRVVVKRLRKGLLVAVRDSGVGTEGSWRHDDDAHGLQVLDEQLVLEYGVKSRIRFFSTPGRGTLVAYRLMEINR